MIKNNIFVFLNCLKNLFIVKKAVFTSILLIFLCFFCFNLSAQERIVVKTKCLIPNKFIEQLEYKEVFFKYIPKEKVYVFEIKSSGESFIIRFSEKDAVLLKELMKKYLELEEKTKIKEIIVEKELDRIIVEFFGFLEDGINMHFEKASLLCKFKSFDKKIHRFVMIIEKFYDIEEKGLEKTFIPVIYFEKEAVKMIVGNLEKEEEIAHN